MTDQLMGLFTYIGVGVVLGAIVGFILGLAVDELGVGILIGVVTGLVASIGGALAARMRAAQATGRSLRID